MGKYEAAHRLLEPTWKPQTLEARRGSALAQVAITKYHKRGVCVCGGEVLNSRPFYCSSSGGWKYKICVPAWSSSDESSPPSLQIATTWMYDHLNFAWIINVEREGVCMW